MRLTYLRLKDYIKRSTYVYIDRHPGSNPYSTSEGFLQWKSNKQQLSCFLSETFAFCKEKVTSFNVAVNHFFKTHYDVLPVNAVIEFLTFDANNATQKKNIKTGYTKMAGVLHDFESIGLI